MIQGLVDDVPPEPPKTEIAMVKALDDAAPYTEQARIDGLRQVGTTRSVVRLRA